VSENSQFLRPTVNGRIAFSAVLFEIAHTLQKNSFLQFLYLKKVFAITENGFE